jgi:rubrerythrin
MGKVYSELATKHAGHARASALWAKTAAEEGNHASQFSLALSLSGDVIPSAKVELAQVDAAIAAATAFLQRVRGGVVLVDEALRKAIELEEQMAAFHLHVSVAFASSAHEKLFRAMMAADKGHISALREELDRLSGRRP